MKNGKLVEIGMLLIISCILNGCGKEHNSGGSNMGAIYGTVTDFFTSNLIENANVRLNPLGEATLTGYDGTFQFDDVPDGTYSLSLSKDGYVDLDDNYNIEIINGKSVRRDVQLKNAFKSFKLTIDGIEIDTLDFGIDLSLNKMYYSIENNGTLDIDVDIDASSEWIEHSYCYYDIAPNTSRHTYVKINREELNIGNNIGYLYVGAGLFTKTLVIKAKGADVPEVANPTIVSVFQSDDEDFAVVSSSVISDGGVPILDKGFEYYNSSPIYNYDYCSCGEGNNNFQTEISSAIYSPLRRVRAYANNGYRTGYSDWVYFN